MFAVVTLEGSQGFQQSGKFLMENCQTKDFIPKIATLREVLEIFQSLLLIIYLTGGIKVLSM